MLQTPIKRRYLVPYYDEAEWPTPQRVKIQENIDFINRNYIFYRNNPNSGIPFPKAEVFRSHGVSQRTGYRILNDPDPRRIHNSQIKEEPRGRKAILSAQDLKNAEEIITKNGIDGRLLTWLELRDELGVNCSARTLENKMGSLNYHRCLACKISWVAPSHAKSREKWARDMLSKYS